MSAEPTVDRPDSGHPLLEAERGETWRATAADGEWGEWRILEDEEADEVESLFDERPLAAFVAWGGRPETIGRNEITDPLFLPVSNLIARSGDSDPLGRTWHRREAGRLEIGDEVTTSQVPYHRIRWVIVTEGDRHSHDNYYVKHYGPGFWCRPAEGQGLSRRDLLVERGPRYFAAAELRSA